MTGMVTEVGCMSDLLTIAVKGLTLEQVVGVRMAGRVAGILDRFQLLLLGQTGSSGRAGRSNDLATSQAVILQVAMGTLTATASATRHGGRRLSQGMPCV